MVSANSLQGVMKWLHRDEWREAFTDVLKKHLEPACSKWDLAIEELPSVIGEDWYMNLWGCAFEDFLTREYDGNRNIVGKGDIAAQTEQILKNIDVCLKAAGARKEHLISWNIYVAQGEDMRPAFEAGMRWWGNKDKPPLNNVMFVSGFGPDFLILIDAIAVVPLP